MDLFNVIERNPILTSLIVLLGIIFHWLWTNVISEKIAEIGRLKIDKEIDKAKKLDKLYEINKHQLHIEMQNLLDVCSAKGYRTIHDTSKFGYIHSIYKDIGGNHDGDILMNDFEKLPLHIAMETPIENGKTLDFRNHYIKKYMEEKGNE